MPRFVLRILAFVVLPLCGGLLLSGLAYTVMGRNFGFENVSVVAVLPGFVVGVLVTLTITALVLRSRVRLLERLAAEQKIGADLQAEIARRDEAETSLRETDELYQVITDTVTNAILVHSSDTIRFANPAAVEMFGAKSADDLLALDPMDLVHPDDRLLIRRSRELRARGDYHLDEQRIRRFRMDGSEFWSAGHARSIIYRGEPANVVVIRDITASVAAEQELQESRARFQEFAEASADWFWETDADLRVSFVSESVERLMGISPDMIVGELVSDLAGEMTDEVSWDLHIADMKAHRPFRNYEYLRKGVGPVESVWIRTSGMPVFDEDGTFLGYRGSAADITEYKQAQEQLRVSEERLAQAQKLESVGQLTGGIAHDFNNLLAVIQGNAEIVEDALGKEHAPTQSILRAAGRGAELTQRLLAFSRRQSLQPRPTDLASLVNEMTSLLKRTLGEEISVETRVTEELYPVMADPGQVENALLNLSINARDAMQGGGNLTIECRNTQLDAEVRDRNIEAIPGDYVVMSVSDTGHGMSPEVREQAFEPFFTTKDVGEGSGLGLSMVYGFAQQSGGYVTIYSEEGSGTTVNLYLPAVVNEAVRPKVPESEDMPRGEGQTILVIEDDVDVRDLAVRMLDELGYRPLAVEDAAGAEHFLSGHDMPDLVLSDVILPGGVSGPEFAETARTRYPSIRIIFMSGYPDEAARRNGFLGSDNVLLNKPFQRRQLAQTIRDALS